MFFCKLVLHFYKCFFWVITNPYRSVTLSTFSSRYFLGATSPAQPTKEVVQTGDPRTSIFRNKVSRVRKIKNNWSKVCNSKMKTALHSWLQVLFFVPMPARTRLWNYPMVEQALCSQASLWSPSCLLPRHTIAPGEKCSGSCVSPCVQLKKRKWLMCSDEKSLGGSNHGRGTGSYRDKLRQVESSPTGKTALRRSWPVVSVTTSVHWNEADKFLLPPGLVWCNLHRWPVAQCTSYQSSHPRWWRIHRQFWTSWRLMIRHQKPGLPRVEYKCW